MPCVSSVACKFLYAIVNLYGITIATREDWITYLPRMPPDGLNGSGVHGQGSGVLDGSRWRFGHLGRACAVGWLGGVGDVDYSYRT